METILSVRGLTKSFSGINVLSGIDADFQAGSVHTIVGENGAGKSTLIKMISGVYSVDSGEILLDGKKVVFTSPREGLDAGISVIHQELSVIGDLTVAENIFLDNAPRKLGGLLMDFPNLYKEASALLEKYNIRLKPTEMVRNLSAAMQQLIEILRAVSRKARVLIMDEPTSSLSREETNILFRIIGELKKKGIAVIYISHRMEEIFAITDTVTVLKDGCLVATLPVAETGQEKLVSLMVGRSLQDYFIRSRLPKSGEVVLSVKDLTRRGRFEKISFDLHRGEVLGVSGLVGAGRTELMRAIFGADPIDSGEIRLHGKTVRFAHPSEAIKAGIGLVPEDRRYQGLLLDKNVKTNISLVKCWLNAKRGMVNFKQERDDAVSYKDKLKIKAPDINSVVKYLSGGNQQKVVISKWLCTDVDIIILDEPTRGIDVSAKREIYGLMKDFVENKGGSLILVSSDLPEIIGVCHRTIVMQEGVQTAILELDHMDEQTIMEYATLKKE